MRKLEIDLSDAISQILVSYTEQVEDEVQAAAEEAAKMGVDRLKETSPKNRPEYYKGWTLKKVKGGTLIHNKDYPGLTHILEKGYPKRSGGRYPAQPHIKPAEEYVIEEFTKLAREKIKKL